VNNAQLINQDSGDYEYYTPEIIIETARRVMGSIDLDPASSEEANKTVKAKHFHVCDMVLLNSHTGKLYLESINGGIDKEWYGNVWMNHPFGRAETPCKHNCHKKICEKRGYHTNINIPGNEEWITKLVDSYESGEVASACCITYASTSEAWFRSLHDYYQCFPFTRTNYYLPDGTKKTGVTKGSVITYLGEDPERFIQEFKDIGSIRPGKA